MSSATTHRHHLKERGWEHVRSMEQVGPGRLSGQKAPPRLPPPPNPPQ